MSYIEGIEELKAKFRRFDDEVAASINSAVIGEAREMQQETAALVPVDTGEGRDALLDDRALRITKSPDGPGIRVLFGLDVPALAKRAFHLFFVEFGTKGYMKGQERHAGFDKKGRRRWRRIKKPVPPRPANPFWRPAEANMWRRLEARLNMARFVAAAKRAAGFADQN
jgi:HK97 gp10 family phage protein